MRMPCVYLLASKPHGTLYIGVTLDLAQRVWQHKCDLVDGFTKQEKALKKWNRAWKIKLIERENPTWADLYDVIC